MKKSQYDENFKEQILSEYREVGNVSVVARNHELSRDTIYSWIKESKEKVLVVPLPKARDERVKELENRIQTVSSENDRLKRVENYCNIISIVSGSIRSCQCYNL